MKDRTEHLEPSTLATIYYGLAVPLLRSAVADKLIGRLTLRRGPAARDC